MHAILNMQILSVSILSYLKFTVVSALHCPLKHVTKIAHFYIFWQYVYNTQSPNYPHTKSGDGNSAVYWMVNIFFLILDFSSQFMGRLIGQNRKKKTKKTCADFWGLHNFMHYSIINCNLLNSVLIVKFINLNLWISVITTRWIFMTFRITQQFLISTFEMICRAIIVAQSAGQNACKRTTKTVETEI